MVNWCSECVKAYFFSAARALRGPLRVRALVRCAGRASAGRGDGGETAVAAEVHQALDVHRGFAAQVTLDGELGDLVADFSRSPSVRSLIFLEYRIPRLRRSSRGGAADAEDGGQADLGVLGAAEC